MTDFQRDTWMAELRAHQGRVRALRQLLAEAPNDVSQSVFLKAQVLKHRIGMALLESRLGPL